MTACEEGGSMFDRKSTELTRRGDWFDPFAVLSRMTLNFDRVFEAAGWPVFRIRGFTGTAAWFASLDVFEKDSRLIARADLPGLKREDVKVEVVEGYLTISGERKHEAEETKENFYRSEREHGSFYRAIPLPEGVNIDKVRATFDNGVLEVTVPLPVHVEVKPRSVAIEEPVKVAAKPVKAA
jgi:HSP20 family protein